MVAFGLPLVWTLSFCLPQTYKLNKANKVIIQGYTSMLIIRILVMGMQPRM